MNKEVFEKLKKAKDPEQLLSIAEAEGCPFTEEQGQVLFSALHELQKAAVRKPEELSDEELKEVSGGIGGDPYSYPEVDHFWVRCFTGMFRPVMLYGDNGQYVLRRTDHAELRHQCLELNRGGVDWETMTPIRTCGCCYYLEISDDMYFSCSCGKYD